ncbi:MAG: InlB B-repeat-containing protein [Clostridiales Family XIII bacterium]|jgi:uncharacterized repeat protein (TIGR02543 family)|nr:InlB B-repeat-containing protein [Clostridiales Family XIII bacterium]
MKRKRCNLALSLLLAVMLVFAMTPAGAAAADAAVVKADAEQNVYVSVTDDTGFYIAKQPVSVHPGLAKEYGYFYGDNVKDTDITALDALVAAHIVWYKGNTDDVTTNLKLGQYGDSGYITNFFGTESSNISFVVNGKYALNTSAPSEYDPTEYNGYAVNQAVIAPGDQVSFHQNQLSYPDSDTYVWFEQNGKRVDRIVAAPGEVTNLSIKGFPASASFKIDPSGVIQPVAKAALVWLEIDTAEGWNEGFFKPENNSSVSDDKGNLSLTAKSTPGTYYYSAYDSDGTGTPLLSPWLEVKVANKHTVTFDANGGTLSGAATKEVFESEPYGALPTATRKNYTFAGWYTAKTGGAKVTDSSVMATTGRQTLYARWTDGGWAKEGKVWKYYADGKAVTGWKKVGSAWYYLNAKGEMLSGWQKISGKYYYLSGANSGKMLSGWQKIQNKWYYLGGANDGAMKTSWQKIGNKWYYLDPTKGKTEGVMKTGTQTIGGQKHAFSSNGAWLGKR